MEPKFETKFERVIGGESEKSRIEVKEKLQKWLEEHYKNDIKPYEISPTERDKQIIETVEAAVDRLITAYSGIPKPFPPEKIHLLRPDTVHIATEGKFSGGFHSPLGQRIVVEKGSSDIDFATTLAHELFHLKSYKAAQVVENGRVKPYRSGISVFSRTEETEYFAELEEASVAEVTRQFYQNEVRNNPLFQAEVRATDKIKEWIKKFLQMRGVDEARQEFILGEIYSIPEAEEIAKVLEGEVDSEDPEMYKLGYVAGALHQFIEKEQVVLSERYRERQKLDKLLEEIVSKSENKFQNKAEIFNEFAKANFSGNLLPLARTIEDILGKGSFRRIAEEFKEEFPTREKAAKEKL